jgi:hypothetical protein
LLEIGARKLEQIDRSVRSEDHLGGGSVAPSARDPG